MRAQAFLFCAALRGQNDFPLSCRRKKKNMNDRSRFAKTPDSNHEGAIHYSFHLDCLLGNIDVVLIVFRRQCEELILH